MRLAPPPPNQHSEKSNTIEAVALKWFNKQCPTWVDHQAKDVR
jgi:hypothetical protein